MFKQKVTCIRDCDARWHIFLRDKDSDVCKAVQTLNGHLPWSISLQILLDRLSFKETGWMHHGVSIQWLWCTVTHISPRVDESDDVCELVQTSYEEVSTTIFPWLFTILIVKKHDAECITLHGLREFEARRHMSLRGDRWDRWYIMMHAKLVQVTR